MVPKLKAKGIQVITLPDGDGWQMQSCLFSTVVGRMLGDALGGPGEDGQGQVHRSRATSPPSPSSTPCSRTGSSPAQDMQLGYGDGPTLFATGKAAFIIDGDWRQGFYITDKSTGQALIPPRSAGNRLRVHQLPGHPGREVPGRRVRHRGRRPWNLGVRPQGLGQGEGRRAAAEVLLLPRGPADQAGDGRLHSRPARA